MFDILSTVKDKHLPKKCKVQSKETQNAKWMTAGKLKYIITTDKLYKELVKIDVDENDQYKTLEKKFNIFKIHYVEASMKRNVYNT